MMFSFKTLSCLLLCCTSLFMMGCYNVGKQEPISDGISKHLYYKEGSYWVFKDSTSNEIDSVYVSSIIDEYRGPTDLNVNAAKYQYVNISLSQYRNGVKSRMGFGRIEYGGSLIDCYILRDTAGTSDDEYHTSSAFPGKPAFTSITVNNMVFSNPVLYTLQNSSLGPAYFVDDVGPVKVTIYYPGIPHIYVWELLRYHVVI